MKIYKLISVEDRRIRDFKKMKSLIEYTWKNVPFYREYWTKFGFEPSQFSSLDSMKLIPIIDKQTVRENYQNMVSLKYGKKSLSLVTSGGTTGIPLFFYLDNCVARAKEMALLTYGFRYYFYYKYPFERTIVLRGDIINNSLLSRNIYWKRSKRENALLFSSFHLSEKTYQVYMGKIREYKPKFIRAYPSSMITLCTLMKRHGDFGIVGLRGIVCSSENVNEQLRSIVKEVLGVELYSFYGLSEKTTCAFQNKKNKHMKFQGAYGYTEFLDAENNVVVGKDNCARVISTGYGNRYFPLIRYDTGDLAEVYDVEHEDVVRIVGRNHDFVIDENGEKRSFIFNDVVFWDIKGVDAYQYMQNKPGELIVLIQKNEQFDKCSIDHIMKNLEQYFKEMTFVLKFVTHIKKSKRGKFLYLIQNIK